MIKKLWNKIKSWFTPKQEIDEHVEFYTKVPESDVAVYKDEKAALHCSSHSRFRKSCPNCLEVVNG